MEELLKRIAVALGRLRFFHVIMPDQMGVRTFCGRNPKSRGPGFHWVCPALGCIEIIEVSEQVFDIREQSLTTHDKVSVILGMSIAYSVTNPIRALYHVLDWDESLNNETLGIVGQFIWEHTFDECMDYKEMCEYVFQEIQVIARRWGVQVHRVRRSDFCRHRALRLITGRSE